MKPISGIGKCDGCKKNGARVSSIWLVRRYYTRYGGIGNKTLGSLSLCKKCVKNIGKS